MSGTAVSSTAHSDAQYRTLSPDHQLFRSGYPVPGGVHWISAVRAPEGCGEVRHEFAANQDCDGGSACSSPNTQCSPHTQRSIVSAAITALLQAGVLEIRCPNTNATILAAPGTQAITATVGDFCLTARRLEQLMRQ